MKRDSLESKSRQGRGEERGEMNWYRRGREGWTGGEGRRQQGGEEREESLEIWRGGAGFTDFTQGLFLSVQLIVRV